MIDTFKDNFSQRDDSSKLKKTIEDSCTIDDLRHEIECNVEYFCQEITFDGGLIVPKLLNSKEDLSALGNPHLISIKENIEKIRNVLVHLRESRENKVILPTKKNDALLTPYLYCVKRLAEKLAIQFE